MINLRFHIVSITAVFLALAIGIVIGSSLLQRATVGNLEAAQRRLEDKIGDRSRENGAFRTQLNGADARMAEFDEALDRLQAAAIEDPLLVVAVRGIDEGGLRRAVAEAAERGATAVGTLWMEDGLRLDESAARSAVARAVGVPAATSAARVEQAVVERVTNAVREPADAGAGAPLATRMAAAALAGLLAWEPAPEGAAVTTRPRVLVVSGEGAPPATSRIAAALATGLAQVQPGTVIACELMNDRSTVGEVERRLAGDEPARGDFTRLVRDGEGASIVSTVDDLDEPFGRLALVLLLAARPEDPVGHYGQADGADRQFPAGP